MSALPLSVAPLPTRRQEDWRYSDIKAVESLWPLPQPTAISVGESEYAAHLLLQDAADDTAAVHDYVIDVAAGGNCIFHLLNIGGRLGRVTFRVTLGRGAHFGLHGAIIGGSLPDGSGQTLEIITSVTHAEPDGTSEQVVRSILGGKAVGSYLGRIEVARHAQKTDASQSVKAMLLDRTATANAKPELEIYADDVKCAHGCAIGELDKQALFYMASRGMDPQTAQSLLLRAFVAGVFDGIADEEERARFETAALDKLDALSRRTEASL